MKKNSDGVNCYQKHLIEGGIILTVIFDDTKTI